MKIEKTVVDMDFMTRDVTMEGEGGSPFFTVSLHGITRCPCSPSCFTTPNRRFRLKLVEIIEGEDGGMT